MPSELAAPARGRLRILFATDGSTASLRALPRALSLAHRLDAALTLLGVVEDAGAPLVGAGADRQARAVAVRAQLERELDRHQPPHGSSVSVQRGEAADAVIASYADVHQVGLIVLSGTAEVDGTPPAGFARATAALVGRARVPVMVFPPDLRAEEATC
jgi:nucleotide-binding universal stress UspA family protein